MSERVTFAEMTTAWRVHACEDVRRRLLEAVKAPPEPSLSEASETWANRMRSALVDSSCSPETWYDLETSFMEYRDRLEPEEREALQQRLNEFLFVARRMPLTAVSWKDFLPGLLAEADARAEADAHA